MWNLTLSTLREMQPMLKVVVFVSLMIAFGGIQYWFLWGRGGLIKEEDSGSSAPDSGINFTGNKITAPGAVFNIGITPQSPAHESVVPTETLRDQIRTILNDINPGLLVAIDSGQSRIPIFLTSQTFTAIAKLLKTNRAANDYLAIESGDNNSLISIGGPYEKYQGKLIEMVPDGPFRDYFLIPTQQLKISK